MQVEGHLAVKRRLESHVAQSRRHSRSRGTRVRGNPLSAQRRTRGQQERGNPNDFAGYLHFVNSFSPAGAGAVDKPFSAMIFIASFTGI